ncbi:AbrB/MazE/SpoVT family DNA-binding domain-containing protein [Pusillimonas sp. SM2304]|nr:AbrB/MazE/SpoVT family DNA-binding domain-containing protein [Pusillimonas sp. SM2304]MDS1140016.1 AbrB/MazE/SpoVT family DNA-binding domain-containing protein [Pusillimonas sp. SM2304]
MVHIAKLFINGQSQAVLLPAEYRFDTKEVFIRKDPITGDVILSRKPSTWDEFFDTIRHIEDVNGFLGSQERHNNDIHRDLFAKGQ